MLHHHLYCLQESVFIIHFNFYISSLIMLQFITSSAPASMSNISALIQPCCAHCVHQVVCLADTCNVTDVCQCDYCHLLNKHCWPVSSMQDIKKSLMSRKFCQPSTSLPITFSINTIMPIIKQCLKVTTITTLHFRMWPRWPSSVSFKLTKWLPWSVVRLHQQCICMSQL